MTLANKLLLATGANPYLEFVSSTDMTITPKHTNPGVTLQYSLNATTWTTIASGETTPSASVIYFRGSATGTKSLFTNSATTNAWIFTGATNLEVNGDITMLIQDILGGKVSDIPLADYCYQNMFNGCTSLIKAPNLPSTTLADSCYSAMFIGCSSLITPPALPATTLVSNCYNNMFSGCTNIKLSTTKTGLYVNGYRVPTVGTGIDDYNTMFNMFINTGGTFADVPTINTTYYTENTIV